MVYRKGAERRLIDRADEIIVLADSSKFAAPSGNVVCGLEEIDILITDASLNDQTTAILDAAGVKIITV